MTERRVLLSKLHVRGWRGGNRTACGKTFYGQTWRDHIVGRERATCPVCIKAYEAHFKAVSVKFEPLELAPDSWTITRNGVMQQHVASFVGAGSEERATQASDYLNETYAAGFADGQRSPKSK